MNLEDNIRALRRAPIFADAEPEALRLIAFAAETIHLRRDDVLFRRGERADRSYVIVNGTLRLEAPNQPDSLIGQGALIGEMALLIETVRPCTAVAPGNVTLLDIPRAQFLRVLSEFPAITLSLRGNLLARLRAEQAALLRVQESLDALSKP